jgi:putative hydrolase of the HAD superfamily
MTESTPTILWDFDGTLVRHGMWSSALIDILDEFEPGHGIDTEQIRPFLKNGFPWHEPEKYHHHLSTPEAWWSNIEAMFIRAYCGVGLSKTRAEQLAPLAHQRYIDPETHILFNDTIPALEALIKLGWKHIILSNHVPELPEIVKALPLSQFISHCITSAITGWEKPNSEAFRIALATAGNPDKVWMIGDSLDADVRGAEAAGIPAILVRNSQPEDVRYYAASLIEAVSIIQANSHMTRKFTTNL